MHQCTNASMHPCIHAYIHACIRMSVRHTVVGPQRPPIISTLQAWRVFWSHLRPMTASNPSLHSLLCALTCQRPGLCPSHATGACNTVEQRRSAPRYMLCRSFSDLITSRLCAIFTIHFHTASRRWPGILGRRCYNKTRALDADRQ